VSAPDLPSPVTDKVTHTVTEAIKSTWQRFTAWLNSLF
jgi:hypothetical protein